MLAGLRAALPPDVQVDIVRDTSVGISNSVDNVKRTLIEGAALALGLGEGAEQRAPMGQAVIGGVITSTLLTLAVVPVLYALLDDFSRRMRARLARRGQASAAR